MSLSLWRDPKKTKHHLSPDSTSTLCGLEVLPFWETSADWPDEDQCKTCTRVETYA